MSTIRPHLIVLNNSNGVSIYLRCEYLFKVEGDLVNINDTEKK